MVDAGFIGANQKSGLYVGAQLAPPADLQYAISVPEAVLNEIVKTRARKEAAFIFNLIADFSPVTTSILAPPQELMSLINVSRKRRLATESAEDGKRRRDGEQAPAKEAVPNDGINAGASSLLSPQAAPEQGIAAAQVKINPKTTDKEQDGGYG